MQAIIQNTIEYLANSLFKMEFEFLTPTENIAKALFINDEFYEFCKGLRPINTQDKQR